MEMPKSKPVKMRNCGPDGVWGVFGAILAVNYAHFLTVDGE
jgi:hypothetical protein